MKPIKTCNACGSHSLIGRYCLNEPKKKILDFYDKQKYGGMLQEIFSPEFFQYRRCSKCGHYQYAFHLPAEKISMMYEIHAERMEKKKKNRPPSAALERHAKSTLRLLKKNLSTRPSMLDYGSGSGLWARIANELGYNVIAYEPHASRNQLENKCTSSWEDIANNKFDVVVCNQVLEHIQYPCTDLEKIATVCKKNTLLYCSVPNADFKSEEEIYSEWPFNGKESHILAPFQHINGFTHESFRSSLLEKGFRESSLYYFRLMPNKRSIVFFLSLFLRPLFRKKLSRTWGIFLYNR